MTSRPTASEITDDQLDALYDALDAVTGQCRAAETARDGYRRALGGRTAEVARLRVQLATVERWRAALDAPVADHGHDDTVPVPAATLRRLVAVARHVSAGRGAADDNPYPDATARRALGELDDAGLLPAPEPPAGDTCGASLDTGMHTPLGPCILRHGHDGPVHKDANGATWWPRTEPTAGD